MLAVKEIEKLTKEAQKECESLEDDQSKVLQEEENENSLEALNNSFQEYEREILFELNQQNQSQSEKVAKSQELTRVWSLIDRGGAGGRVLRAVRFHAWGVDGWRGDFGRRKCG